MEFLDPSLTASPIPSCSPLLGTIRPATADACVRATWRKIHQPINRKWTYGVPTSKKDQTAEVGSLTTLASQHAASLSRGPGTPYKRVLTPDEQAAAQERDQQQAAALQGMLQGMYNSAAAAAAAAQGDQQQQRQRQRSSESEPARAMTPLQLIRAIKELTPSRPGTAMSVQDVSFVRSRLPSRSGPLVPSCPGLAANEMASNGRIGTPSRSAPSTPMSQRGLRIRPAPSLRAITPPDVWVNTGRDVSDAELRVLSQRANALGQLPPDRAEGHAGLSPRPASTHDERDAKSGGDAGASLRPEHLVQDVTQQTKTAKRWGPGHPLYHFTPTRGLMYSVFSELDEGSTGKLSFSQFENACVLCGLKPEQTNRIYRMLDSNGRGYVTVKDWGAPENERKMLDFTRLYVQMTRGASGKPLGYKEINSTALAIQIAMERLKIRNNGRAVSKDRLIKAFEFLDQDGSGALSVMELQDGFNAMGIYVTPDVLTDIVNRFDTNKNGSIEYNEFIDTIFPVIGKSV